MSLEERILELSQCGYGCGQILAILLMDTVEEENPAWVRCMQGLNRGIGATEDVCGCMAAGCCLISYFTGKPGDTQSASPHHGPALEEFTTWFRETMGAQFGSVDCREIMGGDPARAAQYCPDIMASTYEKCVEILESKGLL